MGTNTSNDGEHEPHVEHGGNRHQADAFRGQGINELDVSVANNWGVYQNTWNGSRWSNWSQLPTTPSGQTAVSCVSWGSGRIDAAIIGSNNATYHNYSSGGTWH